MDKERDLPTLGGAHTYRSEKDVFALTDLSTFIVAVFCLIDDRIARLGCLRACASAPTLFDLEVLTIEVIGELFLGLDEDTELFAYFRRPYAHFFPNLGLLDPPVENSPKVVRPASKADPLPSLTIASLSLRSASAWVGGL